MSSRAWTTISYVFLAVLGLTVAFLLRNELPWLPCFLAGPSGMALGLALAPWVLDHGEIEA